MKLSRSTLAVFAGAVLPWLAVSLHAQAIDLIQLTKETHRRQLTESTFENPATDFIFYGGVSGSNLSGIAAPALVSKPGGSGPTGPFVFNASDGSWNFAQSYGTLANLNNAYGFGGYGLTVLGQALTISLAMETPGPFPPVPLATPSAGAVSFTGGILTWNVSQPLTLTLSDPLAVGPAAIDVMSIRVSGPGGFNKSAFHFGKADLTLNFDAFAFTGGQTYEVEMMFANIIGGAVPFTDAGGALAGIPYAGTFEHYTTFQISAIQPSAQGIVGSWLLGNPAQANSSAVITFLPGGHYFMALDLAADTPNEHDGMERGTYTWNAQTGAFSASVLLDTNGSNSGFSSLSGNPAITLSTDRQTLHFVDGSSDFTLGKVTGTSPLVGSWLLGNPAQTNSSAVITFLSSGHYFMALDLEANTPNEHDGMERGTYTWNAQTGAFSASVLLDTNGSNSGFSSLSGNPAITLSTDRQTLHFVDGSNDFTLSRIGAVPGSSSGADVITAQPVSISVAAGAPVTLAATIDSTSGGNSTYQWYLDGRPIPGATSPAYTVNSVQPADVGAYTLGVTTNGVAVHSAPAMLGVTPAGKVAGTAVEHTPNIVHPNGNTFDQVLLTGATGVTKADPGEVTRTSYIDLNGDIVQVEFSGAGSLSLNLTGASGPAAPVKYNQPTVSYMTGHATITITGANETSHLSIFTVGRATAFDPTGAYNMLQPPGPANDPANNGSPLFAGHAATDYDGVADVALVNIQSTDGKFGGLRAANASFFATSGRTGIYAPGVRFAGPVLVHNISASDTATPVLLTGAVDMGEIRITGGDLRQANNAAIVFGDAAKVVMAAGASSHLRPLPVQANQGVLRRDGVDVTSSVITPGN